ncbi:hypothetical protein Aduo_018277 [Ancylostoma duodenale]
MASQPKENNDVLRPEDPGRHTGSHTENEFQNEPEIIVSPAPEEVVQRQLRLLMRIERDLRTLMEKVDDNASLLNDIVQRLGRIEKKLDDLLEWKGNIGDVVGSIRINGTNET